MQIIAFGHKSRVGKDTSAKFLETELRLQGIRTKKLSFAAKLKEVCHTLFAWDGLREAAFYEQDENAKLRYVKLPTTDLTPVEIWQGVGNKLREVYSDIWIDNALRTPQIADLLIITDLRFPNEGIKIHSLGGKCVKVVNDNAPIIDGETDKKLDGWPDWDDVINNSFDLGMLQSNIDLLALEIIAVHKNGK